MNVKSSQHGALWLIAASLLCAAGASGADGGKAKNEVYRASVVPNSARGAVEFVVDTSPIIFYVGTVNRKYHVLLIRAVNRSDVALQLSKEQDSIELEYPQVGKINGLLDLSVTDPATWDALDAEIRTAVAYPSVVSAGEEEGIYVFVPVDAVTAPRKRHEMPAVIHYRIKSLGQPVELRKPGVAAA